MPSLPSASTGGRAVLLCFSSLLPLFLLLLCLGCSCVSGASLREHRLRGSESDPQWGDAHQTPNSDMVKALQYIQGLRQRSRVDAQQTPGAGRVGDGERLRTMMRLASNPARGKEEEEEEVEGDGREDKSEELLQAVLSTLQQTAKASKPTLPRPSLIGGGEEGAYGQQKQQAITPHKKLPLMFEDEDEEGEGDEEEEEEEEEGEDEGAHDSPFKRTNENVEEKYTPQNLATLQSVFDELDKLTGGKTAHKRQDEEDATAEEDEDDGEDMFNLRSTAAYDDDVDLADWGPLRDQEEEEEEEEEDTKHEFDRGLDYVYDENEDPNEDGDGYLVKRSKDPDDVTNLVDYYLLKVLERTEEEEQKRAIEEEEQLRAERRAAQYGEDIDPRAIYQLIQISQKYQIPPEDLLDMMRSGEPASRAGSKPSQISTKKTHSIPDAKFHSRRLPERQKDLRTQEILNILGFGDADSAAQAPPRKQYKSTPSWLRAPPAGRPGNAAPTQRRPLPAKPKDYDDTVDEDELAAYLAAQMLAQYPDSNRNRAGQRREEAGPSAFQQAIQDYFDQMDSDKELNEKRQSEDDERGGDAPSQAFDNEALMKLLSYLKPETEESDDKTAQGI